MWKCFDEARSYFKTPLYYIILLNKNQIMLCFAWGRSARKDFSFIITYFFTLFKFGLHMGEPIGSRPGRNEEISYFQTDRDAYEFSGESGRI